MSDNVRSTSHSIGFRRFSMGVAFLLLGFLTLFATAILEDSDRDARPWSGTIFSAEGDAPWDHVVIARVRNVPIEEFPGQESLLNQAADSMAEGDIDALSLDMTESIVMIDAGNVELGELLSDGRLPTVGEPEVLAGAFTRLNTFTLDGTEYRVVGRLRRDIGGLFFSFLLPRDPRWRESFVEHPEATVGWIDPNGSERIAASENPGDALSSQDSLLLQAPARAAHVYAVYAGLLLVAWGGALLHLAFFHRLARRQHLLLSPMLDAITEHRKTTLGMHVLLYGGFFVTMFAAIRYPFINIYLQSYIGHAFSEGSLGYIGAAYESGNVLRAALATFINNYIVQTVLLTVGISLVIPMIGVLKTLLSFVVVGFGMPPLWVGMAGTFVFHSITMTLELEAYIFACVAVCAFWFRVIGAPRNDRPGAELVAGFKILASGTLLTGIMLALAGLYEATTLILLR